MRSIDLTNAVFANQGGGIDPLGGEAIDRVSVILCLM